MLPVIVLIGRPNVGKSTLFNRLTKTQNALVADYPGLTRDRQYGEVCFKSKRFLLVDTGGMGVEEKAIDKLMLQQSNQALKEADIIFFVVDARAGLNASDEMIAQSLRKSNKPIFLILNKIDGIDEAEACASFHSLGFSALFPVSASHGRGVTFLLDRTIANIPEKNSNETIESSLKEAIKLAFVGRPNVGKSTLINRMLGYERVLVYDMPGTTRDTISIPFERDGQAYVLIDTAGVRRKSRIYEKIETFSIIKTLQAIKKSDVCLMLMDAQQGVTDQDLHLIGTIIEAGRAILIIVNKWDGLPMEKKEAIQNELSRRLKFVPFAKINYISALHGSGVGNLFADIKAAYQSAHQSFSTPILTRLLQELVEKHAPPLVKGRRIKLRYAHSGGQNPPTIVIHGNQLKAVPESYKRYLMKGFSSHMKLVGVPLRLEFKVNRNPYKSKT